ncbi:unnamed protein product [Allacma fusca]|uniref:Hexosyltransferase n=1 Tax=Allacma fusca TaxID=39272 RepID=A0A8J2KI80_9HEXA|nr:unnamed protein product [Allacma fusca]
MPRLKLKKCVCILILGGCLLFFINQHNQPSYAANARLATQNILNAIGSRNTSALVLPGEITVILQPSSVQACPSFGSNIFVLFLVISSPENIERRDAIRSTLGASIRAMSSTRETDEQLKLLFFLGLPSNTSVMDEVKNEFTLNQDLVVDNFRESYLNLTVKTLRMLKWTIQNCHDARFVVKIDDDVHLNLPRFIEYLQKVPDAESRTLIADFAAGFFYVLGTDAVPKIFNASLRTPLFHLEDVFLTGFVASALLNMKIHHIPDISNFWAPIYNYYTTTCSFKKYMIVHEKLPLRLNLLDLEKKTEHPSLFQKRYKDDIWTRGEGYKIMLNFYCGKGTTMGQYEVKCSEEKLEIPSASIAAQVCLSRTFYNRDQVHEVMSTDLTFFCISVINYYSYKL